MGVFGAKTVSTKSVSGPTIHPQLQGCVICVDAANSGEVDYMEGRAVTPLGGAVYNPGIRWDTSAYGSAQKIVVDSADLDFNFPFLVIQQCVLSSNTSGFNRPRLFAKGVGEFDFYTHTDEDGYMSLQESDGTPKLSRANNAIVFSSLNNYSVVWEGAGNATKWYVNVTLMPPVSSSVVNSRNSNIGTDFTMLNLPGTDYPRSLRGQLQWSRVYNLNNIDYGTYPTILDLITDINNNPGAPFA